MPSVQVHVSPLLAPKSAQESSSSSSSSLPRLSPVVSALPDAVNAGGGGGGDAADTDACAAGRMHKRTMEGHVSLLARLELCFSLQLVPAPPPPPPAASSSSAGLSKQSAALLNSLHSVSGGGVAAKVVGGEYEEESDEEETAADGAQAAAASISVPPPLDVTILDTQVGVTASKLFNALFNPESELLMSVAAAEKFRDVVSGPWASAAAASPPTDPTAINGAGNLSDGGAAKVRTTTYIKPLSIPLPLAPRKCNVTVVQRVLSKRRGGFVVQQHITTDAPKGDAFAVSQQVVGVAAGPAASCSGLRVSLQVQWIKPSMVKGIVESSAVNDSRRYWNTTLGTLQAMFPDNAAAITADKAAAAAGMMRASSLSKLDGAAVAAAAAAAAGGGSPSAGVLSSVHAVPRWAGWAVQCGTLLALVVAMVALVARVDRLDRDVQHMADSCQTAVSMTLQQHEKGVLWSS